MAERILRLVKIGKNVSPEMAAWAEKNAGKPKPKPGGPIIDGLATLPADSPIRKKVKQAGLDTTILGQAKKLGG